MPRPGRPPAAASNKSAPAPGAILPYSEAEKLYNHQASFDWGFGDRAWSPFQRRVLLSKADEIGLFGGKGSGKAQPLDAEIWTPYGIRKMGELEVGDSVCNPDGSNSRIIAVHPQGVKKIYRVEFSDGTSTRCTEDHLWFIRHTDSKLKAQRRWLHLPESESDISETRIYTTEALKARVDHFAVSRRSSNGWRQCSFQVPLCAPIRFIRRSVEVFDPYVLGVLLGDGHLANSCVSFTSGDLEIVAEVERRLRVQLRGIEKQKTTAKRYDISKSIIGAGLQAIGLAGRKGSFDKFIPEVFQTSSVEARLDLMAGLIDTDGYVDARGHVSYCTISPQLAKDVARLARGLGARASISLKTGCGYKKDGVKVPCKDAYNIYISSPLLHKMIKLPRKAARLNDPSMYARWKSVEAIVEDGESEARCITVDNPNGLYLTNDAIVTHNSTAMRAWLIQGNPHLPSHNPDGSPILHNISYMFCPGYRALILRRNEGDLADFIARAIEMYRPWGIAYVNGQFVHPCGATIDCGHMKDKTAWQKYIGIEYVRVAIDEAPLIPDFESYEQLRSSQRTVFPELRVQTLLAGNAGGPGTGWIADRFMRVLDQKGERIPAGTPIVEKYKHPLTGQIRKKTRVWLFSTYKDNPKIAGTDYIIQLMSLNDARQRAAYIEGDWDAFTGAYFADVFRADWRASRNEPTNACHVIKKSYPRLESWFPRAIGMDWGYSHEAAVGWLAQHGVTNQIHVYREMVANKTSAERFGYELAKVTLPELNSAPSHSMTLFLGHDAFQKRDERHSIVEMLAMGIARVIGAESVHVPELIIQKLQEAYSMGQFPSPQQEKDRVETIEHLRSQRLAGITIRIAPKTNAIGWQYMRELMRWESIQVDRLKFDYNTWLTMSLESLERADDYLRACREIKEDILPKLQIWDCCPRLIDAIPKAQYEEGTENVDKAHFKGKDVLDMAYYLLMGFRDDNPQEPWESFRDKKLNSAIAAQPGITTHELVQINRHLEHEWETKGSPLVSLAIPRGGRRARNPRWQERLPNSFTIM